MKISTMKTAIAAICVVAAGFGGVKAYNAMNQSETDMLLAENVEALSSGDVNSGIISILIKFVWSGSVKKKITYALTSGLTGALIEKIISSEDVAYSAWVCKTYVKSKEFYPNGAVKRIIYGNKKVCTEFDSKPNNPPCSPIGLEEIID